MNKHDSFTAGVLLAAATLVGTGCETEPSRVEQSFGSSVRNAIALQTADPDAGAHGLDGVKAENSLKEYRGDVAKPEKVERDLIQIRLGK